MELRIEFSGDVVERSELLNGTQSVDIAGSDSDGAWSLGGSFSWNRGLLDYEGEGEVTLSRSDGSEIFATLLHAGLTDSGEDAGDVFDIHYEIDGGAGAFEAARGTAHAEGVLAGETFRGVWLLELTNL